MGQGRAGMGMVDRRDPAAWREGGEGEGERRRGGERGALKKEEGRVREENTSDFKLQLEPSSRLHSTPDHE